MHMARILEFRVRICYSLQLMILFYSFSVLEIGMKYSGVFGRQVCNQMILTTSTHMQHQLPWVHNLYVKEKSTLECFSVDPLVHSRVRVQVSIHRKDYFLVKQGL